MGVPMRFVWNKQRQIANVRSKHDIRELTSEIKKSTHFGWNIKTEGMKNKRKQIHS